MCIFVPILSAIIIQGYVFNENDPLDERVTLRIAIPFESAAIRDYIQYFSAEYPNIEIELIDWRLALSPGADFNEEFDQFMETERIISAKKHRKPLRNKLSRPFN